MNVEKLLELANESNSIIDAAFCIRETLKAVAHNLDDRDLTGLGFQYAPPGSLNLDGVEDDIVGTVKFKRG